MLEDRPRLRNLEAFPIEEDGRRLMALHSVVFLGSTPIGGPIVGFVGDHFGAKASLYLGGVTALIVAGSAGLLHRRRLARIT